LTCCPPPAAPHISGKLALFDPGGQTGAWLDRLGVACARVDAAADLSNYDVLIIGKEALTVNGPGPDITRVRDGLKVIVFEQTGEVLEKRLGFRVAEYGLRRVFRPIPDHPLLAGISDEHLHDWCGDATLLAPRLKYQLRPRYGPTVNWCDIPVTRIWRCGNRGNVASVLIEKPPCGDFRPILDGSYGLQYSPLMEYREGRGLVLLCQLDVTCRSEDDPVAQTLGRNILEYVSSWKPGPSRKAMYVGEVAGRAHLQHGGLDVEDYGGGELRADEVLIAGPGAGAKLDRNAASIASWLKAGGNLLALGLDERDANAFLPFKITTRSAEHISAWFDASGQHALLAGISPADTHNRDPREFPLIKTGAAIIGDGLLAKAEKANVCFCQMVPWQISPDGGDAATQNRRRTYRRASFLVTRLAANMGVRASTPLLPRFRSAVSAEHPEQRWLDGLYLDHPQEWDDPYRFFRW
jgi:beta-galactosidase